MKKILWLTVVVLAVVLFSAGCGPSPAADTPAVEEPVDETPEVEGLATIGLGVVTKIGRSLDYDPDKEIMAMAQVDSVIAAVAFDAEGRVVDVVIDTAQTRVNFDEELQVASDPAAEIKTKVELGDDYGMVRASGIGVEWYEQIASLEEWMVGKTVAEIKGLSLTEEGAPEDVDLAALVTITVTDYIAAVEKAFNTAVSVEPGAESLGLGHKVSIGRSVGYQMAGETEILPLGQVDVVIAAVVFDAEGRVAGVLIDTAQTRVNFDAEGLVTSDRAALYPTKKELGDDYGMIRASEIGVEWYEQIAALEAWMIGRTVAEIKAMQTKEVDAAHPSVPDEPDLVSLVTITVQDYIYAVEEAFSKAR
jgi:uncharacterized OB-fold protein